MKYRRLGASEWFCDASHSGYGPVRTSFDEWKSENPVAEWESDGPSPKRLCGGCYWTAGLPEPEMAERDKLFLACRRNPADDLARLAYADFLGEQGTGDKDAATAEFVRVSCDHRSGGRKVMPKAAFAWLEDNWHRLVPALVKFGNGRINVCGAENWAKDNTHWPVRKGGAVVMAGWKRGGRLVWISQPWMVRPRRSPARRAEVAKASIVLDFNRGFLDRMHCTYPAAGEVIRPHLLADWPDVDIVDWR